jgi:hypothetical protein
VFLGITNFKSVPCEKEKNQTSMYTTVACHHWSNITGFVRKEKDLLAPPLFRLSVSHMHVCLVLLNMVVSCKNVFVGQFKL